MFERYTDRARRDKEAAAARQDFEAAAALRDKEKELVTARTARELEWTETAADRPSLTREFGRVKTELARLGAILREHDIDPGEAPPQP